MPLLREIREAAGKTQEDACRDLGVSVSTVNRHERGKLPLNDLQRNGYALYYGVKPDSIEQPEWKPKRKPQTKRATAKPATKTRGRRAA